MREARTVSNPYVRTLLGVLAEQGVAPEALLAGLRLQPAALADPNGRIAPEAVQRIWQQALRLSGDPLLGLKMAAATQAHTFRALGLAAQSSANLQAALNLMLRYHRLVSESGLLSLQSAAAPGEVCILYTEQLQRLRLLPQQVEAILGGILVMANRLAGHPEHPGQPPLRPLAVSFRHAPQGERAAYRRFFLGCEPEFGAQANALRLAAADLLQPLPHADPELHRAHCALLERQLAGLPAPGSAAAFARQWLSSQVSGALRVQDLAQALGLSVRALQRQLQQEGANWSQLVDAARKQALQQLLAQGCSLDEAARRLKYHDASSLSRAARRWFGQTAGEWREGGEGG